MLKRLVSATVLLAAIPAFAQGPGGPGPRDHGFRGDMGMGMRTPVTNAPYSATYTSTSTEKLQDGTVLTHTSTRVVARDSLGRTREEITMPARGTDATPHTMVMILDPVTHTVTQIHPESKTAFVHTLPTPPAGGFQGHHAPQAQGSTADQASTGHGPHENKNVVKTDLGSKTLNGVVASGTRTTRTIPAGEMGNTTPLISTHEEWFSPDLKIELSRSDVDPFHGTHTTSVSSLTKAEPDATLFAVPTGYTVQQAPQHASGRHGGPGAPSPGM